MISLVIVLGSVLLGFLFCTAIVAVLAITAPNENYDAIHQPTIQLARKCQERKCDFFADLSA